MNRKLNEKKFSQFFKNIYQNNSIKLFDEEKIIKKSQEIIEFKFSKSQQKNYIFPREMDNSNKNSSDNSLNSLNNLNYNLYDQNKNKLLKNIEKMFSKNIIGKKNKKFNFKNSHKSDILPSIINKKEFIESNKKINKFFVEKNEDLLNQIYTNDNLLYSIKQNLMKKTTQKKIQSEPSYEKNKISKLSPLNMILNIDKEKFIYKTIDEKKKKFLKLSFNLKNNNFIKSKLRFNSVKKF